MNLKDNSIFRQILHAILTHGLSERGNKEAIYYAANVTSMFVSFQDYHNELKKIDISKHITKAVSNWSELSESDKAIIWNKVKQERNKMMKIHNQTVKVLRESSDEFETMKEETKERVFDKVEDYDLTKFVMDMTGHDRETVLSLYNDWKTE